MSFRVHATDHKLGDDFDGYGEISHQVYGNHEFPAQLQEYLEANGAEIDGDSCFRDFEVKDIQALFEVMLDIHNEQVKDDSYWDLKPSFMYKTDTAYGLLSYLDYKLDCAIVLTMYNFYNAFRKMIDIYWDDEDDCEKYRIKDGYHIYLSGY